MSPPLFPSGLGLEELAGDKAHALIIQDGPNDPTPDDRIVVGNVETSPWRPICCLKIFFTAMQREPYIGTGILIAPDVMLTAAHNLYSLDPSVPRSPDKPPLLRARSSVHIGMKNGTPGASARFKYVEVCPNYTGCRADDPRRFMFDYGVAQLDTTALYDWAGKFVDVVGQTPMTDGELSRARLNVAGYQHGDQPLKLKSDNGGTIPGRLTATNFYYRMDTMPGQSGAAVFKWLANEDEFTYAGVHVAGTDAHNFARRYDGDMRTRLSAWRSQFGH